MYELVVRRPVAVSMIVLGVLVFGIIAYQQLPLNLMPHINYPRLTIRTEYPSSGPEEVELELSRPIESILGTIGHLIRISSRSRSGLSEVILEFNWRVDLNLAMQEVREKLDLLRLPEGSKNPILLRYDPNLDPMMRIGLSSKQSDLYLLRTYAEDVLQPALETMPGVAAVQIRGGLEREVEVALDEHKIRTLKLDISLVVRRLKEENINLAGGQLKEGTTYYWVRTLNEFQSLDDMRRLIIAQHEHRAILLRDIATIQFRNKDPEVITRINGSPSVELAIFREADANIVHVSQQVKQKLFGTTAQKAFVSDLHQRKTEHHTKDQHKSKKRGEQDKGNYKPKKRGEQDKGNYKPKRGQERESRKQGDHKGKQHSKAGKKKHRDMRHRFKAMQEEQKKKQRHIGMTNFIEYRMPSDFSLRVLHDQAVFIRNSIDEVLQAAVMGGGFAILVLLLFMRDLWSTMIIALSIPLSVVATFGGLYLTGVSLNIMSLGGLALGIGMLVDNSIVVLESILRCREDSDEPHEAAIKGVSEVGSAVTASTLTTVAVFFPIVFVQGISGQLLRDLALTVVLSLISSLIVALYFIPTLSALRMPVQAPTDVTASSEQSGGFFSRWLAWRRLCEVCSWWRQKWRDTRWVRLALLLFAPVIIAYLLVTFPLQSILELLRHTWHLLVSGVLFVAALMWKLLSLLMRWLWMPIFWLTDLTLQFIYWSYPKILNLTLQHRLPVISLGLIFTAYAYYQIGNLKQEFMPKVHQGEFHVEIAFPVGTPLLQTAKRLQAIERDIAAMPNVANLSSVIGVEKTAAQNVDQGEHTAVLTLSLHGRSDLESLEREVIEQIRNLLLDVPSLNLKIVYPSLFSLRTPIEVEIKGENLSTLNNLSQQMLTLLQDIPSLRDIRSSAVGGLPEIRILFQRERMLQYGFNVEQLANTLRDKLHGTTATRYRIKEHRIDVSVRVKREQLKSVGELLNLSLISPSGVVVPLHQIARTHIDEGPSEIMRIGNRRSVLILAEVEGMALGEATSAIENQIAQLSLPPAYTANLSGQSEEMKRSLLSLLFALMLSVFLVYLVMASQFESLLSPLIILFSIPLAFIGVILLFLLLDMPISSMVLIGVIILTGIVVNNAIVLVDAINRIRSSGSSMDDSIRDAAKLRLRPILMTTITTALGLMPLALGLGEGSELRRPLAITIMAGLIFSTMLTLLLIPALYKITHLRRTENI